MLKKCLLLLVSLLCFASCKSKSAKLQDQKELRFHKSASELNLYVIEQKKNRDALLDTYVSKLSLEEKIAQLFIENLEGNTSFRSYESFQKMTFKKEDLEKPLIAGGYLFFGYNICDNAESQIDFMQSIKDYCKTNHQLAPFLAIDQEGGFVNRLQKLSDWLPSQQIIAENNTVSQAYEIYENQAKRMKELGFHMNLAPVIEVCTDDNKDFIQNRSFGSLENVVKYGTACVNAYENNGIATVVKHFPGNTNTDPHTGLPEITLSKEDLEKSIESFRQIIKNNPAGVLMSHARTSAVDSQVPACLSSVWITEILRKEYGYSGIIFSDDIFMGALADNGYPPETAAILAIDAGIDCIMITEKRFGKTSSVIYQKASENSDFAKKIDESAKRILSYKLKAGIISFDDLAEVCSER